MESIAFPSIGTGSLNYPVDSVAKSLLKTAFKFLNNNSDRSFIINFVIHEKEANTVSVKEIKTDEKLHTLKIT